jgi:hypothetical protein
MFVRIKPSGPRSYLQVVENKRDGKKTRQRVIATLGRLDRLEAQGDLDSLAKSLARFSKKVRIVEGHRSGRLSAGAMRRIGPALVLEKLWKDLGLGRVIQDGLLGRKFGFPVERAIFLTVLHRLFASGSDRAADKWKRDHRIDGADDLSLHHLYRAMAWLGREKENVEKSLFASTRDLFTELDMVFFDTTSLYFIGRGGETLGANGHSKDHRPDLKQMVVGAALDGEGRPVACEMWPGNKSDAKALVPAVDRLRKRFGIKRATVVADRGMISKETIADLEKRDLGYILGARMRSVNEVKRDVLSRQGRYRTVRENLRVKEVVVEGRRYVVCENPAQARKDKADREAILASLEDALKKGAKSLVGNKGYRKYLAVERGSVSINRAKAKGEARYDGKFVLRTNVDLAADQVALKYKELWRVEHAFRTVKSVLDTRPIYHKCDETIKGHVFASFLALVVMHEMDRRLAAKGHRFEWEDVKRDLDALSEVEVADGNDRYWLRTEFVGATGKALQALGIAAPAKVRRADG